MNELTTNKTNELTINKSKFDAAKNRLKEFSETEDAEFELEKVRTDGGFLGLGSHKVTGEEFNSKLATIQNHFISSNKTINKLTKEFRQVYNTFEALDKDYLTRIVSNVKALEKTSNDVRKQQNTLEQHNNELEAHQSKLEAQQEEIESSVSSIKKVITSLKVFKEKLDGYSHLKDVDAIWNTYKAVQGKIESVTNSITKVSQKAAEDIAIANNKNQAVSDKLNKDVTSLREEAKSLKDFLADLKTKIEYVATTLDNQIPVIQETYAFSEHLKSSAHLDDVDSMWDNIQKIEADILEIQKHSEEIDAFVAVLSHYNHLNDIDTIWYDLDVCKTEIEKINEDIQTLQKETKILASTSEEHTESIAVLSKKSNEAKEYAQDSRNMISKLEDFKSEVSSLNHLMNIDDMWKDTEEHKSELADCKKRDDELSAVIQKNKEETDGTIAQAKQTTDDAIESLKKKINYAYLIAGGSFALALIELIIILLG